MKREELAGRSAGDGERAERREDERMTDLQKARAINWALAVLGILLGVGLVIAMINALSDHWRG